MKHVLLIIIFCCSCSLGSDSYKKSSHIENHLSKENLTPWFSINTVGSDYALQSHNTNSILLFNSACRNYEENNLKDLSSSLLAGIENLDITEKTNSFYHERNALEITANGKLDGIKRFFKIITIQKNFCIYDYILISDNLKNLIADSSALKLFLQRIILK